MQCFTQMKTKFSSPTAVTIGKFDGLHLGHRLLINSVKRKAEEYACKSLVFSFYPPPLRVLKGEDFASTIFTRAEKTALLEELSIDVYVEYPFTKDFAAIAPTDFVNDVLIDKMNCRYLAVGANYRFGKEHSGTAELLKNLAEVRGVKVEILPEIIVDGRVVSSSGIRTLLAEGEVKKVRALLSGAYFVVGKVAQGKKIGRSLGFPTANIVPENEKFLPKAGVYLTQAFFGGAVYPSITNVGKNPTVGGSIQTVETYMLGFEESIYGEEVKVEFIDRLRGEIKFPNETELKEQINKDVLFAVEFFTSRQG